MGLKEFFSGNNWMTKFLFISLLLVSVLESFGVYTAAIGSFIANPLVMLLDAYIAMLFVYALGKNDESYKELAKQTSILLIFTIAFRKLLHVDTTKYIFLIVAIPALAKVVHNLPAAVKASHLKTDDAGKPATKTGKFLDTLVFGPPKKEEKKEEDEKELGRRISESLEKMVKEMKAIKKELK